MVGNCATSVRTARRYVAGIRTFVGETSLVGVAIDVSATSVSAHVLQANMAEETIVVQSASEQAIAIDALFVKSAFVVDRTNG